MPTKSSYVDDKQIIAIQNHIEALKNALKEVKLAEDAGISLAYSAQDISKQIASLEQIVRTYSSK